MGSSKLSLSHTLLNSLNSWEPQKMIKFKLANLKGANLRYEVVYKNLLRDFRKFFISDFNKTSEYIKRKRRLNTHYFIEAVRQYLVDNKLLSESKSTQHEQHTMIFTLGALIYPKYMLNGIKKEDSES